MGAAGLPLAGMASSVAGSALGNSMGGGSTGYSNGLASAMNTILSQSLQEGLTNQSNFTGLAIGAQNQAASQSSAALNNSLNAATNAAYNNENTGLAEYMGLNAPYSQAGYNALGSLESSLGLPVPQGGNANLANSLFNSAQMQALNNQYGGVQTAPGTVPTAPNLQSDINGVNNNAIYNYLTQNSNMVNGKDIYTGVGANLYGANPQLQTVLAQGGANPGTALGSQVQSLLGNNTYGSQLSSYNTALQQYQAQMQSFQNYSNAANNIGYNPQEQQTVNQYQNGSLF